MTVRVAIIGAGVMGADHASTLADLPGVVLTVICDASKDRAAAVAETHGAQDVETDPEQVIARADVDAVIVASPDFTHAPLSLACIRAGKPVLCEKPLSQSPAECLRVMDAEIAAGRRFVQLGFMRRYDQSYVEMKAALSQGLLGRALLMHNFHRNVETPGADFTGAMAITNSAPHEFDIVRHVLGTEITAISAFQPKRSDASVAPVVLVLETADAQLVTIEINNNAAYGYDVRGELVGEKATIALSPPISSRLESDLGQRTAYALDWRQRFAEAYRRQNRDFLVFAASGVFPASASDCWDGYAAAVIAESGVRALAESKKIAIAIPDTPALYV